MKHLAILAALALGVVSASAAYVAPRGLDLGFPVYTNKPLGRQLTGGHAPAGTEALSPEQTQRSIAVPPGFEVRLFASEPAVVNPVAMTWDERGRLWVLELYEYPKGALRGQAGRDRIKILEDTDNDGKADTVKVWADGFSLAEGFVLGNGGAYVAAPPNLYFLRDTDHDDKADTRDIVLTGLGAEDRHELLNGLAWGPDGWLYMTHGVFTYSKIKNPSDPDDDGVSMNAALARFEPQSKRFEVFADGTSNPWGVDWNEHGDAFVEACVIHHLFHMAPGGLYNRQGGTWPNPYGYVQDLPTKGLPAIVDWRHYRAAHAGICVFQGDQWPAEWRGLVFLGNIHEHAVNCDRLTAIGATYRADRETTLLGTHKGERHQGGGNFFVSADPWVMPVSVQTGPDGAMWVMDWYDRYPCYQNAQADPDGVDRELGRIWRVVWTGGQPGRAVPSRPDTPVDLSRLADADLVSLLGSANSWHRRQAQRLLRERDLHTASNRPPTAQRRSALVEDHSSRLETRLAALWSLRPDQCQDQLETWATDSEPDIRVWAARYTGEAGLTDTRALDRIRKLASDPDPRVRSAAAVALRQFTAGALTVTKPAAARAGLDLRAQCEPLIARPSVPGDFYYPHIVWMAIEPLVARDPRPFLPMLAANPNTVAAYCAHRVMRRICDLPEGATRSEYLNAAFTWLGGVAEHTLLAEAALDGLIEAQKSKGAPPTTPVEPIFARLTANQAIANKAQRLAAAFGDQNAARALMALVNDSRATIDERLRGIAAAREAKTPGARDALLTLIRTRLGPASSEVTRLKNEAVQALVATGSPDAAHQIVEAWKELPAATRIVAAESLVRGTKTARALLAGVEKGLVASCDISATARRALSQSDDSTITDNAVRLLGRYRTSSAEKLKLIEEKKRVVLTGTPDVNNGHQLARTACFVCHKLYGEGADVGPDLTGVGRSSLDALLHNVIDPNEVIGNGYETTEVQLKDDTTLSGRVVEESDTRIKLLASGPTEHTIAKQDIKVVEGKLAIRKLELSLMPEGLEQMPDKDFRDMIMFILNPPQEQRAASAK